MMKKPNKEIKFRLTDYRGLFAVVLSLSTLIAQAQEIATLEVTTKGKEKFGIPVQLDLDALTHIPDSALQLLEVRDGKSGYTAFQIEASGNGRTLHWIVSPSPSDTRVFKLMRSTSPSPLTSPIMAVEEHDGAMRISGEGKELLQYQFKMAYPPSGVDSIYGRSGFIHPLKTPSGHILTRTNAPDHYHHWGLWNPWTRVLFDGETFDLWNLADRKGTVRFGGFTAIEKGAVYAKLDVLHQHNVFLKQGSEKTIVNELQSIKVYRMHPNDTYYVMDITSQLSCATSLPVTLPAYRYGGMTIRATEQWRSDNSTLLTSENLDRKKADGSTARWCLVEGQLGDSRGGLEIMSHPGNYNHPEPLRVWPENANGRGDVFVNFSPIKNKSWQLEPGKTHLLKYRFLIFDNTISKEEAEEAWQSFAHPPVVKVLQ